MICSSPASRWRTGGQNVGCKYEKSIFPCNVYGLGIAALDAVGKIVFPFDKVALTKGQVLRIYFYEKGGGRNYVVKVGKKDVVGRGVGGEIIRKRTLLSF